MGTQLQIELWDRAGAEAEMSLSQTLDLGRVLTPAEQRRVLQALCNFGRTLQLWLGAEGQENYDAGLPGL